MTDGRLLVPVSESVTLRNTVAYAVRQAREAEQVDPAVHFVFPYGEQLAPGDEPTDAEDLLQRVAVWADDDLGEEDDAVEVETAIVGIDRYLFSPADYVETLESYATAHSLDTVVLDPEFDPSGSTILVPSLTSELERTGLAVLEAPVERPARRSRLARAAGVGQFLLLATVSYGFYLLIGGTLSVFNLVTGAVSGLIVATVLWHVSFTSPIRPGRLLKRVGRMAIYTPYLLWEIAVANLQIAYVVLHPRLPIDPKMVEFDAAVWSELPVTTLANSITLTPGTLTVDVNRQSFTIHTLTEGAREDLFSGSLERAVRFVFYGRQAAKIPSPRERGEGGGEES